LFYNYRFSQHCIAVIALFMFPVGPRFVSCDLSQLSMTCDLCPVEGTRLINYCYNYFLSSDNTLFSNFNCGMLVYINNYYTRAYDKGITCTDYSLIISVFICIYIIVYNVSLVKYKIRCSRY